MTCSHKGGSAPVRGYNGYSQEKSWKLSPGNTHLSDAKDARESLDIGPLSDPQYPNLWLANAHLPDFRHHVESFYTAFHTTGLYLLEALELGLALPSDSLLSRASPDASELRLNHYPPISTHELCTTNTRRIWPHTDLGIFTLLIQDSEGGLEFEDRTQPGSFLPVKNDEQSDLIVNVSDTLERWTNGLLRAGLHQVSTAEQWKGRNEYRLPSRYSTIFLYRANGEKSVGPMPQFVSETQPALFDEITALGFLEKMNEKVYG
ncbi:MAG: hypothetical protein Q9187_000744 [Circinaria calcarea]